MYIYMCFLIAHPNRSNAKKDKKEASCSLCKPHKRGYESNFKKKERAKREQIKKEL